MAEIIIPTETGYELADFLEKTKTLAEWRGETDYREKIDRTVEREQRRRQEVLESLSLRAKLKMKLFRLKPDLGAGVMEEGEIINWKEITLRRLEENETRFKLEQTGENLPFGTLEFVDIETIEEMDVNINEDGFGNCGYKRLYEQAMQIADNHCFPFVALGPLKYTVKRRMNALSRDIPYAEVLAKFYVEKKAP